MLGLILLVIVGIIITEIVRPKPVNWRPSYTSYHTRPWGAFILYKELANLFPNVEVITEEQPVYKSLESILNTDTKNSSYIFINNSLNFDNQVTKLLLEYAANGNKVFIAAEEINGTLTDSLNFKTKFDTFTENNKITLEFTDKRFSKTTFNYKRKIQRSYFSNLDSTKTTILANSKYPKAESSASFIYIPYKKGGFFIHTIPKAFSNYYMLGDQETQVSNSLSYLPNQTIYWDNYMKAGRVYIKTPMRFVLQQPALKWAYYLSLVGLLLFMFFKAKREQRIIPIIPPLRNDSIDFTETVGTMYFQTKNYKNIALKKIQYFNHYVRETYFLNLQTITEQSPEELSKKSGKPLQECRMLLDKIIAIKTTPQLTEEDLIKLHKRIKKFKQL